MSHIRQFHVFVTEKNAFGQKTDIFSQGTKLLNFRGMLKLG